MCVCDIYISVLTDLHTSHMTFSSYSMPRPSTVFIICFMLSWHWKQNNIIRQKPIDIQPQQGLYTIRRVSTCLHHIFIYISVFQQFIFSPQASLTLQAFLKTPSHGSNSDRGKNIYVKKEVLFNHM